MKVKLNVKKLADIIKKVKPAMKSTNAMEMFNQIALSPADDTLILKAGSDGEIVHADLKAAIEKIDESLDQEILINAKTFFTMINRFTHLKSKTLTMTESPDDSVVKVTCGHSRIKLTRVNDQFVKPDDEDADHPDQRGTITFMLTKDQLKVLSKVSSGITDVGQSRPALSSNQFLIDNNSLAVNGTDSHSLIHETLALKPTIKAGKRAIKLSEPASIIVPYDFLKQVDRMFDTDVEIKLTGALFNPESKSFNGNWTHIWAQNDQLQLYHVAQIGNYPDIDRLLIDDGNVDYTFDRQALIDSIKNTQLVNVSSSDKLNNHLFTMKFYQDHVELKAHNQDADYKENVAYIKRDLINDIADDEISFDSDLVLRVLNTLNSEQIKFKFVAKLRPVQIEPVDTTDIDIKALATPMRTY